jgi:hypothetical protein
MIFFQNKIEHISLQEVVRDCGEGRTQNYHYLALVLGVAVRMERRRGYAGVEVLLCMCDSIASFLCGNNSSIKPAGK